MRKVLAKSEKYDKIIQLFLSGNVKISKVKIMRAPTAVVPRGKHITAVG